MKDLEQVVAQTVPSQGLIGGLFRYALDLQHLEALAKLSELANSHVNAKKYNEDTQSSKACYKGSSTK